MLGIALTRNRPAAAAVVAVSPYQALRPVRTAPVLLLPDRPYGISAAQERWIGQRRGGGGTFGRGDGHSIFFFARHRTCASFLRRMSVPPAGDVPNFYTGTRQRPQ